MSCNDAWEWVASIIRFVTVSLVTPINRIGGSQHNDLSSSFDRNGGNRIGGSQPVGMTGMGVCSPLDCIRR